MKKIIFLISVLFLSILLSGCRVNESLCHSKRAEFDRLYSLTIDNIKVGKDERAIKYEGMAVQLVIENPSCFPKNFVDELVNIQKNYK